MLGAHPLGCATHSSAQHGDTEQVTCCSGLGPMFPRVTAVFPTQAPTGSSTSPGLLARPPWSPQACAFFTQQFCRCGPTQLSLGLTSMRTRVRVEHCQNGGAQGQPPMPPVLLGHVPSPLAQCSAASGPYLLLRPQWPPYPLQAVHPSHRKGFSGLHFLSFLALSLFPTTPHIPSRFHFCRCPSPPPPTSS